MRRPGRTPVSAQPKTNPQRTPINPMNAIWITIISVICEVLPDALHECTLLQLLPGDNLSDVANAKTAQRSDASEAISATFPRTLAERLICDETST